MSDLSQAIKIDEKFWPAYILKAEVFYKIGYAEAAIEELVKVISSDPTQEHAHRLLAAIHW
jgi:Tfp pilus assembly protein PilF